MSLKTSEIFHHNNDKYLKSSFRRAVEVVESGERKQQVLQPVKKGNFNNYNNFKVHLRGCSVMITLPSSMLLNIWD